MTRHIITTITCLTLCLCAATAMAKDTNQPTKTKVNKATRKQAVQQSQLLLLKGKNKEAIKFAQNQLDTDLNMPPKHKAKHYKVLGIAYKHLKNTERACHFLGKAIETGTLPAKNERGLKKYMTKLKCAP